MSISDTSKTVQDLVDRRYAAMSLAERIERMRDVTLAVHRMALAGLRHRHPNASPGELLLELARLRLGDELVDRVYGLGERRT